MKFRAFNHLGHNCLILNNLEKQGVTNPCFTATLLSLSSPGIPQYCLSTVLPKLQRISVEYVT